MTEFKKIFALLAALALGGSAASFATPVSREYVDTQIGRLDGRVDGITITIQNLNENYIYSSNVPPTNALNSVGQLFRVHPANEVGGVWHVSREDSQQVVITYDAYIQQQVSQNSFKWQSDGGAFQVTYNMNNGSIAVSLQHDDTTDEAMYSTLPNCNPMQNKLTNEVVYVSGHVFDSLSYTPQGPNQIASTPYASFVYTSTHNADVQRLTQAINGKPNYSDIPSTAGLASQTYVDNSIRDSLFRDDPYLKTYYDISIVGRLHALEQTTQEYAHNVVYDLWADDLKQVITGKGDVYNTTNRPYGIWERFGIESGTLIETYMIGLETNGVFRWTAASTQNKVEYDPASGNVSWNGTVWGTIERDLNPLVGADLGIVSNDSPSVNNYLKFTVKGWVKNSKVTSLVFDNQLASKTVTGLKYDGSSSYSHGNITLPDYRTEFTSRLKTDNMYGDWSSGYKTNSIVGRIHELEGGGANKAFLNKSPMSDFTAEATQSSIVGTLDKINKDYTTHANVTNIAGKVASNSIDTVFIKSKNFYDKTEVNTLIENMVEQKRVQYLYDDVDNPSQVLDSAGRLYKFGIEDLGGSFNVTFSDQGQLAQGQYIYAGFDQEKYVWTNAANYSIWYNPTTGKLADPSTIYDATPSLNPENCDSIPDINTGYTTATFTPQAKTEPDVYSQPYAQFATKKQLNSQVKDALDIATNSIPQILAAKTVDTNDMFNPLFQILGGMQLSETTYNQLSPSTGVRIPMNTMVNPEVEIGFNIQFPTLQNNTDSYVFLKPSSSETLPLIGFTNKCLFAEYPSRNTTSTGVTAYQTRRVVLKISKASGKASLVVSNLTSGAASTLQFPTGSSQYNYQKQYNDYIDLTYANPIGSASSVGALVNLRTVYVKYGDTDPVMLVGRWAREYQNSLKVYAEQEVVQGNIVTIGAATTERYGVVKPDGVTVRLDEAGRLTADAGGVSDQQVRDLIAQTNAVDIAGSIAGTSFQTNSVLGRTLNCETRVTTLEADVKSLNDTIGVLNARLQQIINVGE